MGKHREHSKKTFRKDVKEKLEQSDKMVEKALIIEGPVQNGVFHPGEFSVQPIVPQKCCIPEMIVVILLHFVIGEFQHAQKDYGEEY